MTTKQTSSIVIEHDADNNTTTIKDSEEGVFGVRLSIQPHRAGGVLVEFLSGDDGYFQYTGIDYSDYWLERIVTVLVAARPAAQQLKKNGG